MFLTLEHWLVIFSVILFILKILRNSLNSSSATIPILAIPYLANIPFYQCTFLLPFLISGFERIKKKFLFPNSLLFLKLPSFFPCSHPLTTSPAHLWPPTPPQPFHHQLGLSQRNDSWNHKSKGGRDLKGQLIQPPN